MNSLLPEFVSQFIITTLELLSLLFIFALGVLVLVVIVFYVMDRLQTAHAIRRNYPVLGRFRYFFEHLGEFFRQYFFAMDREELPFNRAQRSWVYRAAKDIDRTVAFGSTKDLSKPGTIIFVNSMYPTLHEDEAKAKSITIGPDCPQPFTTNKIVNISGMSFGALSKPAVQALSRGAKLAGCWMNTGEGGLSPWHLEGGCDLVFQIGTAKYGVRDEHGKLSPSKLESLAKQRNVRMFEIKLSQGAKPGKGGILPAEKVSAEIARIRAIPEGEASISPNRHPELESVDDLLDMIDQVRTITGKPTGIKTVLGDLQWLDQLFTTINERGPESAPDFFTLDSADGGTGAAPMPLIDDVGLPLGESLPILADKLSEYGLRERIKVIASGKLVTPSAAAAAICLGADFIVTARGFMFSLGCIQALQCNKNTCPTGITTHDRRLQRGLDPANKSHRVFNFQQNLEREIGIIAHSCGVSEPRLLSRQHARIILGNGRSIPLDELFPQGGV